MTSNDYKIQVHEQKAFYDAVDKFNFKDDGFMVGAAITAYDGSAEDITDPSIGELKFIRKSWGLEIPLTMQEIPSKPCNEIINVEQKF